MLKSIFSFFSVSGEISRIAKTIDKLKDKITKTEIAVETELDKINTEFSERMTKIENTKNDLAKVKSFFPAATKPCQSQLSQSISGGQCPSVTLTKTE